MLHGFEERPDPPSEVGEPCRQINSCVPIELYYEFVKLAPELECGGPRAWIRTAGGRLYTVPLEHLTTAAPVRCASQDHADVYAQMIAVYVLGLRELSKAPAGGKRRETALERRDRMERWEGALRDVKTGLCAPGT